MQTFTQLKGLYLHSGKIQLFPCSDLAHYATVVTKINAWIVATGPLYINLSSYRFQNEASMQQVS